MKLSARATQKRGRVRYGLGLALSLVAALPAQVVYWVPEFPVQGDPVSIYYDVAAGTLPDNAGQVYIHMGVNGWNNVQDHPMIFTGNNSWWRFDWVIPADVSVIDFVFRDGQGNWDNNGGMGIDWHIPVLTPGLNAVILEPAVEVPFGDPHRSPLFAGLDDSLTISVTAVVADTPLDSLFLLINSSRVAAGAVDTLRYEFVAAGHGPGPKTIAAVALDTSAVTDTTAFVLMVNPPVADIPVPGGIIPGITYHDYTSVTLALFAPWKEFVYAIGDFNDWRVDTAAYMRRYQPSPDSTVWWLTLEGLSPGTEYAFQYLVDGRLRVADPYADKVLDPWNDPWIPAVTYPGLKPYPDGKTREVVAVLQTAQTPFTWTWSDTFTPPPQKDLVIHEMLLRDYLARHDFQTLRDTLDYLESLGVNALELMPVNEFEGNSSWGYNPSFYFAPDKYYGRRYALKALVDECHRRRIAVIIDMVLNHSYGQAPLVRLYWDAVNNRPAPENPWYNVTSPNPVYSWGYDFDHQSIHTQAFVDRVNRYWLTEYRVDGFRFDFTKGFTNTPGEGSNYDPARIAILRRMADRIREVDSSAYIILEHFTANSEEQTLADYGLLIWGNMNYNYSEAAMGWNSDNQSNFSWGYYGARGWSQPHLVTYMESHDEERLMFKNLQWGNGSGSYDITAPATALERIKLVAAFFLTLPGPKMLWQFGELGYDVSIDDPCRLCEKPIRWNYFQDPERRRLYKTIQALLTLRQAQEVFRSPQTQVTQWLGSNSGLKRIHLSHPSLNVSILGNFGVVPQPIIGNFQHTGWWYDYFSGDSLWVAGISQPVPLAAGEFHIFSDLRLEPPEAGLLGTVTGTDPALPAALTLSQNYPNPGNAATRIEFTLPEAGPVTLTLYDLRGREIVQLVNAVYAAGSYRLTWNGRDRAGHSVPSGIYLYRLRSGSETLSRKLVLLR